MSTEENMAMRVEMQDDYAFWRRALVGHKAPVRDGEPEVGFYRLTNRKGSDGAVAFFRGPGPNDGVAKIVCTLNGTAVEEVRGWELWSHVARNPVAYADYQHRINSGRWPNEIEAALGHNQPPKDDSFEGLTARIDALAAEAKAMLDEGAAKTQVEADRASDLANLFGELQKKAIALHKVEKEPHLEAGRSVDKKWFPLRDSADNIKSALKRYVITPFLQAKRAEQAALAEKAEKLGVADRFEPEQIGAGSLKRTTALRTRKSARIDDIDTLWKHLKGNPEVVAVMQRLADAAARVGNPYPGTIVIEEEIAQ